MLWLKIKEFIIFRLLLLILLYFVYFVSAQENILNAGQRITIIVDAVKVRDNPGLSATQVGKQSRGTTGTVVSSTSVFADGFYWWQIDYDGGADGWSAQGNEAEPFLQAVESNETFTVESMKYLDVSIIDAEIGVKHLISGKQ